MAFNYHEGELAVQRRAGESDRAARSADGIHATIPPVAADFFASQPLLIVAFSDDRGRAWASPLSGSPGFARATDERSVLIRALPAAGDPLEQLVDADRGRPVALLAIEPISRQRMRVNGRLERWADGELAIAAEEVFANCPKYIQARVLYRAPDAPPPSGDRRRRGSDRLTPAQQQLIANADTFFVATAHPERGIDVSHRGGSPGFVSTHDERRLSWPDYPGNAMYMTLGNLEVDSSAGLLVIDWETGDTHHLTGRAVVDWSHARAAAHPRARRVIDYTVDEAIALHAALPLRGELVERSRLNPPLASAAAGK